MPNRRRSHTYLGIVAGLIVMTFGMQFTSVPIQLPSSHLAVSTPEPQAMIATANDVAATLGWPESATLGTYQGQEYVTLRHNETTGNCAFSYFVVVGEWELSSSARRGNSMDFHGYNASRNQAADGTLDSLWWHALVDLAVEVSSYDCPPVDAMPLAEALYAAAARNGLLQGPSPTTPAATPTIAQPTPTIGPVTLSVSVVDNYTAIAADGVSELLITATLSRPLNKGVVDWTAVNLATGDNISQHLSGRTDDFQHSSVAFRPPEVFERSFDVEIRATLDALPSPITERIKIKVVRPPVILVHGIWSGPSAMLPLENAITSSNLMSGTIVVKVDYSASSNADMTQNVGVLGAKVTQVLTSLINGGTKASRVDIVAHSLGGLIARLYLQNNAAYVRKLITLATPHLGTEFANWYHALVDSGLQSCAGGAGQYTSQLPTQGELDWFLNFLRSSQPGMRSDALQYGEAVKQLQTREKAASIPGYLGFSLPGSVQYYFLYGDAPILSSWKRSAGERKVFNNYPFSSAKPGDCQQTQRSAGFNQMVKDFIGYITKENTDGVVPIESARGDGLNARETTRVHANHFSIVANTTAIHTVVEYLSDQEIGFFGSWFNTYSPGHLHVYDDLGNHVGLDEAGNVEIGIDGAYYLPYSTTTGDHESIWVPPGVEGLRLEFVADEEGIVGLEIGQGVDDGAHLFYYEDVEVQPGSIVAIQAHPTDPEGQITQPDGETISLSPTFSQIGGSSEESGHPSDESGSSARAKLKVFNPGLICACLASWTLLAGGLLGVIILRRRQPIGKKPIMILGIAALVLTIATCLLGASLISDKSSDESTPQATATMTLSPKMEIPASSPAVPVTATSESLPTSMAELTLINDTDTDVCYVLISPITSEEWGEDWLGSDEVIPPGDLHTFQVANGTYDLAAADCDGNLLTQEYAVDISGAMEWIIEE